MSLSKAAQNSLNTLMARAAFIRRRDELLGPESGWDPLHLLLEVALGAPLTSAHTSGAGVRAAFPVDDPELRVAAAKELASYLYPKLKAVEHRVEGGDDEQRHAIVDELSGLLVRHKLKQVEPPDKETLQ